MQHLGRREHWNRERERDPEAPTKVGDMALVTAMPGVPLVGPSLWTGV
jgi:hypothetical protein